MTEEPVGSTRGTDAATRPDLAIIRDAERAPWVHTVDVPPRFGVLGQLEVRDDGDELRLGGHRQQLVLAVLLDRANERISVGQLIDAVWGEAPPATARKTLQAYVSRLRRILGDGVITSEPDGYRLHVDETQLDALRFELLATDGARLTHERPGEAAESLRAALALWRGSPFGSLGDETALRVSVVRLLERRLEVLEQRIEADLACSNDAGVIAELEALVSDHPLRENLHRLRMLALYRAGRQADALDAAQQLRTLLADELGLEPSPAVQELQRRILAQDPALLPQPLRSIVSPANVRSAQLGSDRETAAPPSSADAMEDEPTPALDGDDPANPYRGLRPFDERDAALFFGRRELTAHLLVRVEGEALTTVVGPSGSGKSSVVRAGLLPAVRAEHPDWVVVTMLPGAHPFAAFEAALVEATGGRVGSLAEQFRGDELDVLRAVLRVTPEDGRLLLVIDQLEELFLLAEPATRDRFAQALVEAIDDPNSRLTVVGTIRADFLDRPLQHSGFGPYVEPSSVLVPPLSPAELERASVGPARGVGVAVAPELVAQLVADVASEPAALPLFQYTLTELFDARAGGPLTMAGYRRLGGLQGALARRADELLGRLGETDREAARQVFLRLVTLGEGAEDTRRRAARTELEQLPLQRGAVERVLRSFGDARLVAFDRDAVAGGATVEVAHEALLREWPVLQEWIAEARADLRLHRTLSLAAAEWTARREDESFLLAGGRLASFDEWHERSRLELTRPEQRYLDVSRSHAQGLADAEEARRARELALERRAGRRLRALVGVMAVAALVASGLGVVATDRADEAADARDLAAAGEQLARANELAARATVVSQQDPDLGMLLALHAASFNAELDVPLEDDVMAALHWTLQAARVPYGDTEAEVLLVEGPDRPRGIYALPANELVALVRGRVPGDLTSEQCLEHLGSSTCPPPLMPDFGRGLTGEQPRTLTATPEEPLLGTRVTVFGGVDNESEVWVKSLIDHTSDAAGGIDLRFNAENNFDQLLTTRGQEGGIDILGVAQPSFVPEQAAELGLQDVSTWVDVTDIAPHLAALGTLGADGSWPAQDGTLHAVPYEALLKGLVWYRPSVFEDAGYEPPATYGQLVELVDRMVADGRTPWCLGYASGNISDGWPGTDVIEALLLRDIGPTGYDAWVRGDLPFQSTEVRRAFERYAELMLAPGRSSGIGTSIQRTGWQEAGLAPFTDDRCLMSVFFNFIASGPIVRDAVGADRAYFAFPATSSAGRGTVLASGTQLVVLTDRPEVRAVVAALFAPEATRAVIEDRDIVPLSAHADFDVDGLDIDPLSAQLQEELTAAVAADTLRFDGSDLMPRAVWIAFNAGMVTLVEEGPAAIDRVLADIDAAWDEHRASADS